MKILLTVEEYKERAKNVIKDIMPDNATIKWL